MADLIRLLLVVLLVQEDVVDIDLVVAPTPGEGEGLTVF